MTDFISGDLQSFLENDYFSFILLCGFICVCPLLNSFNGNVRLLRLRWRWSKYLVPIYRILLFDSIFHGWGRCQIIIVSWWAFNCVQLSCHRGSIIVFNCDGRVLWSLLISELSDERVQRITSVGGTQRLLHGPRLDNLLSLSFIKLLWWLAEVVEFLLPFLWHFVERRLMRHIWLCH